MKIYISLFVLLYSLNSFSQTTELLNQKDRYAGKYFIIETSKGKISEHHTKDEDSTAFIIRIIPPIFDTLNIIITLDSITDKEIIDGKIRWNISPEYNDYKRYTYYEECMNVQPELGRGICIHKSVYKKRYTVISLNELKKENQNIEVLELISNGKIEKEIVSRKPKNLKENEYYFPKKIWSGFIPILCCLKSSPSTLEIEKRLQELGYESNLNGEIDEMEIKSLTQYQKDNGLSTGSLNMDTLKAMGLVH